MISLKASDVDRSAAFNRRYPDISDIISCSVDICHPLHIRRKGELSLHPLPTAGSRDIQNLDGISTFDRHHIKAFVADPEGNFFVIRRDLRVEHIAAGLEAQLHFLRFWVHFKQTKRSFSIGDEEDFLAIFRPIEVTIPPRVIGQSSCIIGIALFWLFDRDCPEVAVNSEENCFAVGRWFRFFDAFGNGFTVQAIFFVISCRKNCKLDRFFRAFFKKIDAVVILKNNITGLASNRWPLHRISYEFRNLSPTSI